MKMKTKTKKKAFLTNSLVVMYLFMLNDRPLYSMARLYFEKDDSLIVKVIVLLVGMTAGILASARLIYPRLLETEMNPFKARNIFNATVFAFLVLWYGITFHTTVDILFFSIALGVIMVVWMLAAIIKS